MQRTSLSSQLQAILNRVPYATIATVCADGSPWNSPVYARTDDNLHTYWASWTQSQHSRNIACDPRIFVVVYDSLTPPGTGLGLYMQMRAHQVDDARVQEIRTRLFGKPPGDDVLIGPRPRRLYEAVPEKIWHNSKGSVNGHFVDRRQLIWQA